MSDLLTARHRLAEFHQFGCHHFQFNHQMRARRLAVVRGVISEEEKEKLIEKLQGILDSETKRNKIIKEELIAVKERYGESQFIINQTLTRAGP